MRSWDLVARYVIPAVNGHLRAQRESAEYVGARKVELMAGAGAAIMSKIMSHEGASAALATTMQQMAAARPGGGDEDATSAPKNDPTFRPGGGLPTATTE